MYAHQIKTVFNDDNIVVGYIARRSVVVGCSSDTIDGWMVTKDIFKPQWHGNYPNRIMARRALCRNTGA